MKISAQGQYNHLNCHGGAPFFFVKKKDRKLQPVQDYEKLNLITKKNKYPLPLMSELFDELKETKYYSKLDVR